MKAAREARAAERGAKSRARNAQCSDEDDVYVEQSSNDSSSSFSSDSSSSKTGCDSENDEDSDVRSGKSVDSVSDRKGCDTEECDEDVSLAGCASGDEACLACLGVRLKMLAWRKLIRQYKALIVVKLVGR
jgi:hypothetical protein